MRNGLTAKKAMICTATSTSDSGPDESQKLIRKSTIEKKVNPSEIWICVQKQEGE
tara:strand:+ start:1150 stop:1314 length:165 start_codon:yes stop_codon:yes gene_type:complete